METFVSPAWAKLLEHNRLADFDSLWNLSVPLFDQPNTGRGGWSAVARVALTGADGDIRSVFVKRQENHTTRSFFQPWAAVPTFQREMEAIDAYQREGIPTLDPVFFAAQRVSGNSRAILVTAALDDYHSLDDVLASWQQAGQRVDFAERKQLTVAVAALLKKIHRPRYQHNCFFPKHVFVKKRDDAQFELRIIDLEKSRRRLWLKQCFMRDIDTLNRHATDCSRTDRLRFFLSYFEAERMTPRLRRVWRALQARNSSGRTLAV